MRRDRVVYHAAYRQRPEIKAKKAAYEAEYRQRPDVKAKRTAYHAAHQAAYRTAHPEKRREQGRRVAATRRARIAQVLCTLTKQEWETILEMAGRACIYCGSQGRLSQDHLIPISRGGPHTAENVVPACMPCNISKGAQAVGEFLKEARP